MESMKHILALVLMVFGLVGCAVSTPLLVDFRVPYQKYGDWTYTSQTDEFEGDYVTSKVRSLDGKAGIWVGSNVENNFNYLLYENGDSYICSINPSLRVQMIFKGSNGEELKTESFLSRRDDGSSLIARRLRGGEYDLVSLLNKYEVVIIRTNDDCGTNIDKTFSIKGTTHLRPMES